MSYQHLIVLLRVILFVINPKADYLYMSCHDHPNIIVYDVNTSELVTTELLDISGIDWIDSDDLHFRGLAIESDILYVANSKKDYSFIGEWECNQSSQQNKSLPFMANFTGVSIFIYL